MPALPLTSDSVITPTDREFTSTRLTILSVPAHLTRDCEHQDETFASAFSILRESIAQRAFPAASIAVTHEGRLLALRSFGHFTYEAGAPSFSRILREGGDSDLEVTPSTLFDLASLTKPVATTPMAAILYERGLLELDSPVVGILPEFLADDCHELDPRRHEVTFRMLLAHSSGLPAYEKLFLSAHTRDELLLAALTTALSTDPGTRAEYSDIGFIVLGAALERIAEESLDAFCQREIFGPLAMTHTTFNPPADIRKQIPPTADDATFRHRVIQGEVQDENASIMGGVAGHAGLFSTAEDLAIFAHTMLQCGAGTPAREMPVANITRKWNRLDPSPDPPPGNHRPLHPPRTRARRHFPRPGLGHALDPFAIRKIFRPKLLRSPRLHRHFSVDRSRPPTFHHSSHQPHLARLLKPSHQTNPPPISRRDRRSPAEKLILDSPAHSRAVSR